MESNSQHPKQNQQGNAEGDENGDVSEYRSPLPSPNGGSGGNADRVHGAPYEPMTSLLDIPPLPAFQYQSYLQQGPSGMTSGQPGISIPQEQLNFLLMQIQAQSSQAQQQQQQQQQLGGANLTQSNRLTSQGIQMFYPSPPVPAQAQAGAAPKKSQVPGKNEDDYQIVACRARSMPMDHNFKTAYFTIPPDAHHGQSLVCSYPACRDAGVKFRYCLACELPVAKRNFRNRHENCQRNQGGKSPTPKDTKSKTKRQNLDEASRFRSGKRNSRSNESNAKKTHQQNVNDDDGNQSEEAKPKAKKQKLDGTKKSKNGGRSLRSNDDDSQMQQRRLNDEASNKAVTATTGNVTGSGGEQKLDEAGLKDEAQTEGSSSDQNSCTSSHQRRLNWTSLLSRRPLFEQGDAMSAWLMEVLAISNPRSSLTTSSSSGLQNRTHNASSSSSSSSSGFSSSEDHLISSSAAFCDDSKYYSSLTDGSNVDSANESLDEDQKSRTGEDPTNVECNKRLNDDNDEAAATAV